MAKKKSAKRKNKKNTPARKKTRKPAAEMAGDIIQLILKDHKPLKELIEVMKDTETSIGERHSAFHDFAPMLLAHAKPEEHSLYVFMKRQSDELRIEGLEGDVEHALADKLIEEAKHTQDEDLWSARVKVLAELVEHHIEEEEEDMLPDFKKHCHVEERVRLGKLYLEQKSQFENEGAGAEKRPTGAISSELRV